MCIYTAMIRNYEKLNEQSQAAHSARNCNKNATLSTPEWSSECAAMDK
jgi:hypothetical protein